MARIHLDLAGVPLRLNPEHALYNLFMRFFKKPKKVFLLSLERGAATSLHRGNTLHEGAYCRGRPFQRTPMHSRKCSGNDSEVVEVHLS